MITAPDAYYRSESRKRATLSSCDRALKSNKGELKRLRALIRSLALAFGAAVIAANPDPVGAAWAAVFVVIGEGIGFAFRCWYDDHAASWENLKDEIIERQVGDR